MNEIVKKQYLDPSFLQSAAKEIEEVGYIVIPSFFSEAVIERAVNSIDQEIAAHGREYFSLRWQQYQEDSVLREIRADDDFRQFLFELLRKICV